MNKLPQLGVKVQLCVHLQGTQSLALCIVYVFVDADLVAKMLMVSILVILVVEILVVEMLMSGCGKTKDGKDN